MENRQYSLLVVALYCHIGHVKSVIEHLMKKNPLVEITLLSNLQPEVIRKEIVDPSINIEWYNVSDVNYIKSSWLRERVIRYKQNRFFSNFSKKRSFDIVNIHFPKRHLAFAYKYIRRMSKNVVISPWGSDVLRQNAKALKQLRVLYRKADYIATSTQSPLGKKILQEFNIEPDKFAGGFFGTDIVDYALKYGDSISQDEAKERFGLEGRYVITCGYNRKVPQRHKEIITAIDNVRNKLPKNLTLLFPMTYANPRTDYDYVEEIKQICFNKKLPAVFVTDFLSIDDVYKLRKATDIFVHVQTTDSASRSVQEYILCDKKIVHGSWMKYEMLEAFDPLFYFPVNKMEELGDTIVKAYKSDKIKIPQGVKNYVMSRSWECRITMMNDFFMSIV